MFFIVKIRPWRNHGKRMAADNGNQRQRENVPTAESIGTKQSQQVPTHVNIFEVSPDNVSGGCSQECSYSLSSIERSEVSSGERSVESGEEQPRFFPDVALMR